MKKILIFDFDGTIADTFHLAVELYNTLAPKYGCKTIALEDVEEARGMKAKDLMRKYGVTKLQLPFFLADIRTLLKQHLTNIAPCAGIRDAVVALREADVTLGILTSNAKANVDAFLKENNLEKHFLFVVSSRHLFGKHRAIKKIIQQNSLNSADVAYIGDEIRDVEAGKAAGVTSIAVSWGFQNRQALEDAGPDHLIADPAELLALATSEA